MPELPSIPRTPVGNEASALRQAVAQVFASAGRLSRSLDQFESRPGQQQMAQAVADTISDGGMLLAEAGTGTGKTLAYLIPALLAGQRILVSTGTKNLQEQIYEKDLPLIARALGLRFSATLMKGRSNYLCLHRWEVYRDAVEGNTGTSGRLIEAEDRVLLPVIDTWIASTSTGDRAELDELPEDLGIWKNISADAETCLGSECPRYSDCYVTKMRQRASDSDVVIVNHHLLCADAAVRHGAYGEVIPAIPNLVVDEAHQLEDVATQYFGVSMSSRRVEDLVRDGERLLTAKPLSDESGSVRLALERVAVCARRFFVSLAQRSISGRGGDGRTRYTAEQLSEHFEDGMRLCGALEDMEAQFGGVPSATAVAGDSKMEGSEATATLAARAGETQEILRFLMKANDTDYVYFLEARSSAVTLHAALIDVSRTVRDAIFGRSRATILTSATLAVDGTFDYARSRLGIDHAAEVRVASEFDYTSQTLLYLPRTMPSPRAPDFSEAVARESMALLGRSRGRAFVLFTSYAVLRDVQRILEMSLPFPLLVQGSAPRSVLVERFRTTPNAVLLATSSFWQGVDVVGEALSCVIIDKLPFASPGDPVTAARIDAIITQGGEPFVDYQVPLAILALQQGLGRLIRHRNDRGVLAILDPRLKTMGYGRRFLASLPPAPVTDDLSAVSDFFG